MCRQDSRLNLSAEEEIAAEESLSIYCKPVELYNILQRRAIIAVIHFTNELFDLASSNQDALFVEI